VSNENNNPVSWKQNLRAVWFTELIAIVGFAVVIPILPLYLRHLGLEGERETRLWSGLIFSAHSVTMAIFSPIWGALSDRYGRKVMVERAMFGGAATMVIMGFARTPVQLTLLRAVQGALTGTVTAATTLVAASAPEERVGYALGTLQMAIYVGASAGPLLGGLVADTLGYRAAFFLTGGLLLVAAVAVLIFVREPLKSETVARNPTTADGARALHRRAWRHLAPVVGSAPILGVLAIRLLMKVGSRLPRPTLPLFVEALNPPNTRVATMTGLITAAGALGGAIGGRQLGKLSDRIGYRTILVSCAAVSVLFLAGQSMVRHPLWLIPLQAGAGFAMGGILSSVRALLANLAPDGREGIVYGVESSVSSIANAIGPMTGSALAAGLGLRTPFSAAAVIFAMGLFASFWLIPKE
jgi:DHA1 family multidrug resistance protein-like MFS transporter